MLVRLYDLPPRDRFAAAVESLGVTVRRARSYEKEQVLEWVHACFGRNWASECSAAFAREPVTCFIAVHEGHVVAFIAYEVTCRDFAGPIGVAPEFRGRRIGHALLCACLHAMADLGYAYAIIGGVTELAGMAARSFQAIEIPGSSPGIYVDRLAAAGGRARIEKY